MMTGAEDRATVRTDLSADSGAKTEWGGTMPPSSIRDWQESDKSAGAQHRSRRCGLTLYSRRQIAMETDKIHRQEDVISASVVSKIIRDSHTPVLVQSAR